MIRPMLRHNFFDIPQLIGKSESKYTYLYNNREFRESWRAARNVNHIFRRPSSVKVGSVIMLCVRAREREWSPTRHYIAIFVAKASQSRQAWVARVEPSARIEIAIKKNTERTAEAGAHWTPERYIPSNPRKHIDTPVYRTTAAPQRQ